MARDAFSTRIKAIDKKLAALTPINAEEYCIFKVHDQLLKVNEKAYKPVLLAIGPYNDHGKVGQGLMEEHKLRYLSQMLRRTNESSVEGYIEALRELEERARRCYAERISLTTYEFVEMMLLDGCFIIELFRKLEVWSDINDDPIFQISWMLDVIARDLMLFENQLPYFVLTKLFEMSDRSQAPVRNLSGHFEELTINIEQNNELTNLEISSAIDSSVKIRRLADLAISFFSSLLLFRDWDVNGSQTYSTGKPFQLCRTHKAITPPFAKMVHEHLEVGYKFKNADFKHLLDLIHTIIRLSILDMELHRATERQEVGVIFKNVEIFKHLFCRLIHRVVSPLLVKMEITRIEDWDSIPYGTELREAGVKFKMAKIFLDKLNENKRWESIPDAVAFQEAGIEFKKAMNFCVSQALLNRNEDDKSKPRGAKSRMVKKFMCLLICLNKMEDWNSIPDGRELREAGVDFMKAKKFRDAKNMLTKFIKPISKATELEESGVKFKKAKHRNKFAIKFSNGVLEISPLRIEDETETFLRNLIAYEQYNPDNDSNYYVTDYMYILDDLIDSPKDVELLRRNGIIENYLGNDEVVSTMVNNLRRHVTFSSINPIYYKTSIDTNKYCDKRWNEWKAKLRHDYFNSPWASFSVFAAISLLGLAVVQTIFSIIH
ncbi:hypothetical protein I3843_01G117800 [Carya illinoinensis]|nr:hypothetical protein I3843_01G117800 [Carya illinoinensis]